MASADGLKRRRAGTSLPDDSLWCRAGVYAEEQEETVFNVRMGPDYNTTKAKAPSASPYYLPVAVDVFRTPSKVLLGSKRAHTPEK
jgi:hypothetical protein